MFEFCHEIVKLGSNNYYIYSNRQKPGRPLYQGTITQCDRQCIEGDGFETHRCYAIVVTQPL
jgi:hypothetical protein